MTLATAGFLFGFGYSWFQDHFFKPPVHLYSYGDTAESFYDKANDAVTNTHRSGARSGIVAHHLLVAEKIAETLAQMGTGWDRTVVVLSPNHFDQGSSALQTTIGAWKTPYGNLEVDERAVNKLVKHIAELQIEPDTFEKEHGVAGITPFIKKWFPHAKLVPLVIHESATPNEVKALAKQIQSMLPNAVVIASIDMSHNLPEHIQIFHDEVTLRAIENGECDCELEIDANAVLQTLFAINDLRGTQNWHRLYHGSSLSVGATNRFQDNTSHILGYFKPGKPEQEPFFSMQFVGDVMLDRGVRTKIQQNGEDYPWKEVTRFLSGTHLTIANLEGPIGEQDSVATETPPFNFIFDPASIAVMRKQVDVVSLANNHSDDFGSETELATQTALYQLGMNWFGNAHRVKPVYRIDQEGFAISLIGYHQFGTSIEELQQTIQEESKQDRFVIVYPHWGNEYVQSPQDNQRVLAKQMIDAGADLIIGSHPHVVQGIEMIDHVPVIYSLGNFVFDQGFDQTNVGMMAGVLLEHDRVNIQLSPVSTVNGQPIPLSDKQATSFFTELSKRSAPELQEDLLDGALTLPYEF